MPGHDHGKSIKAPKVYEALRREGYSKQRAAAISNATGGRSSGSRSSTSRGSSGRSSSGSRRR